ncbi:MAG: hypothetical protein H7Y60_13625 [Rhodospirillaceae bacterium]|nr:hypothetical protein [Rhodospirillales bacterium]
MWKSFGLAIAALPFLVGCGQLGIRDLGGYLWPEPLALEDGIVLVDGLLVSLDEIQAALTWHPKVAAAAVLAVA